MAKLIQSGEFVGRGERATAARLEADLPDHWVIISNKQLVNPDGSSREVDFIVVGDNVVYTIDEKSYRGTIRGSDIAWVLPGGGSEKSPISNCEMIARRLVGHLTGSVPRLRQSMAGRHFVFARVVLSSLEADCRVNDPRVQTQVLRLETCADELVLFDRQQPEKGSINPFRKAIIDEFTVLRDRPRIPKTVGDYEILELIESRGMLRILRARHRDGTEKLLHLIEHADTAISERAASAELMALREYDALRRLAELGRAPLVDPYFTWNEGQYWAIPVHLLPGKSLRACREAGLALDPVMVAADAFAALHDVHDQGIVHRALSPETVVVRDDGTVAFTDFSRSRLPGELSLAPALEPPAGGDPYASEEIRLGYGFAEPPSDVFSLAGSIINWATGYEPASDGPWQPDERTLQALSDLFGGDLADKLRLCLADDRLRPSAATMAEAFGARLAVVSGPANVEEAPDQPEPRERLIGVGATIAGRYLIGRELGAGGSARTYLASDTLTDQQVVLKVFDDPELAARLAPNEFRILGSLNYPSFPRVYEVNRPSDPYQLKLEYVDGRDLKAILEEGAPDPELATRLWRELGGALSYLEGRGLCHRDISPANILIPSEPSRPAQLIDFGVATVATGGKTAVGTSWYRDPEVEGGVGWSSSADRYSLAVCVFQTMFGRLPFAVDEHTGRADKTVVLAPSAVERHGVPDFLVAALMRALEPDGSRRYSSAPEWVAALEAPARQAAAPTADITGGARAAAQLQAPSRDGQRMLNGRYLLVPDSMIAGGIADVYRAIDVRDPDHAVAVKIIRQSEDQDWMVRLSFDREIGSLRALKHDHIVSLIDAGQDVLTGEYFIVLEWLPKTLEHLLDELPEMREWDTFSEAVALPLARAIAFAHEHRVVHRDIKPSNILVTPDGILKLADFGISALKNRIPSSPHTLADFMSRPFAPPERESLTDYDRDVFAFGVLVVDCLSSSGVEDYPDIDPALAELAVPEGIFDLLRRCVSFDPLSRPRNGLALVAELEQLVETRPTIGARLTVPCVLIGRYLEENLRQAALKRGVATAARFLADELSEGVFGKRAPGDNNSADQYVWLIGRTWRFRAKVQRTPGQLQIIGGGPMEAEALDFERERGTLLPFRFDVNIAGLDPRSATDAVSELVDRVLLEEQHQAEVESAKDERKLFVQWSNQVRARQAFEGSREDPLEFSAALLDGSRLRLDLAMDLAEDLVGQQRIVRSGGHLDRRFAGTVSRVHGRRVEIVLERDPGIPAPRRGAIVFDTGPSAAALKRQRDALYALRYQTAELRRLDLPDLLLNPDRCTPAVAVSVQRWEQQRLDDAKRAAVQAALGSSDFFVVHGPPGTGKTTFIAELVAQEIARNPDTRILITSQTHVALDNALVTMRRVLPEGIRLTRLASVDDTRVDERVEDLLLEKQLPAWRREIRRRSEKFLDRWAVEHGLELEKARAAVLLSELLGVRDSIAEAEQAAQRAAARAREVGVDTLETPDEVSFDEISPIEAASTRGAEEGGDETGAAGELADLRRDEAEIRRKLAAALSMPRARLERMGSGELAALTESIIPVATPAADKLLQLIRLHREWVDRAARGAEFDTALLKISNVVAATCVGLAGFPSAQELAFDLCILDEASKATPTESLVPFVRSRRWVLVGDQYQLPPFQERALEEPEMVAQYSLDIQELKRTIFDRLAEALPGANSVLLRQQHRMTRAIGDLISHVFYAGQLQTERSDTLEGYELALPKPVVWLSTSSLPNRHEARAGAGGQSYENSAEADALVDFLVRLSFVHRSRKPDGPKLDVLALSGYRPQVSMLQARIDAQLDRLEALNIEVNTVDAAQGREADVVALSVVRSNVRGGAGFLSEARRINVGLSRARVGLAVIGDLGFCEREPGPLRDVIEYMRGHPDDCRIESLEAGS